MDFEFVHRLDKAKNQWNISIQGEIDIYNSSLLKDKLYELLEQEKADLYIDCEGLEYIDSTGLGSLVSVLKKVKQFKGNIHLSNLKPNIAKIFKITDLNKVFVIEGAIYE
ncbi:MAG TPA: STAS domain-containing protein [Defluviitaleaceae bacterium]|nr:STAS domain-containing protein [Candidatus Epulonipiscium sp.]HPT76291.1 STAS domain-containing protein [Defluviitaleaceae bacterium]HQD50671.1 STAS domain-containing protein [Defluviitaleaceae bacterium]